MFLQFLKVIHKYFYYIIILSITACSSVTTKTGKQNIDDIIYSKREQAENRTIRHKGTFFKDLFNPNKGSKIESSSGKQLAVNPFLWQASLDILSSTMPLSSVDSNSGIIITDWYTIKNKNNERVKISVLISSKELRADGVKVSIFKQVQIANSWNNSKVNPKIIMNLERKIIQKAASLSNSNN